MPNRTQFTLMAPPSFPFIAIGIVLFVAVILDQPMVGVLLIGCAGVAWTLSCRLGVLPWLVLAGKLSLLVMISVLVPIILGRDLIPLHPDQEKYITTVIQIADAIRNDPFAVDYARIVKLHNRLYHILLGWLMFLNGTGNVFLYRLFNVFLSMLFAGLAYALARMLYPTREKAGLVVFLGSALLPSVNAYAMFVLREVLLATLVMLIAFGIVSQRHWVSLASLALVYYTRIQLLFLLVGGWALFFALGATQRFGRWGPMVRGSLIVGFVVGGYFVAPFLLPPEYDYSSAWNITGLGWFLARFIPSLLSFDFLFATEQARELGQSVLGIARLVLIDTWVIPLLFLASLVFYKRMEGLWRRFYLWVWGLVLGYAAGYWLAYGSLMVRLWVPWYALLLLAAAPLLEKICPPQRQLAQRC